MVKDVNDENGNRELPATPKKAVAGYYRMTSPANEWIFYDGSGWVGEPRKLPWFRHPVNIAVGRAPVWVHLFLLGLLVAIVVFVHP